MANSIITVDGDGSTTQYALNFTLGILKREYVTCRVGNEVDGLGDPVYRTLEWITDGLVNIQGAVPGNGVEIVFRRTVPKDMLIHDYSDGVPITEENLDESNLQNLMAIHEFLDGRLEGGFGQDINMNNFKIINVAPGVADTDAANMSQINAVIGDATAHADLAQYWAVKTDGLVESIDNSSKAYAIGGTGVTNTAGKGAAKEWATKTGSTVDTAEYGAKEYAVGDLTETGGSAKAWAVDASSPNGTSDLSAKSYAALAAADRVQTGADRIAVAADKVITETARDQAVAASNGMKYRSVRAATTGNITRSGTQTIDTVAVIAGDRVLVRAQTAPAENGIYVVSAGSWTRAFDADTWDELVSSVVVVEEGTAFVDYAFLCTSDQGGTLGVTAVTYILWQTLISPGQITNDKLADGSVTTNKIAGGNVTLAKLANQAASSVLMNATNAAAPPTAVTLSASQLVGRGDTGNGGAIALGTNLSMSGNTLNAAGSNSPLVANIGFDGTQSGAGGVSFSNNLSKNRTGIGVYSFTFGTNQPNTAYIPHVMARRGGPDYGLQYDISGYTGSGFTLTIWSAYTNSPVDPVDVKVSVLRYF